MEYFSKHIQKRVSYGGAWVKACTGLKSVLGPLGLEWKATLLSARAPSSLVLTWTEMSAPEGGGHLPALQSRHSHRAKLKKATETKSIASTWQHCRWGYEDSDLSCVLTDGRCCELLHSCLPAETHLPHKADQPPAYANKIRPSLGHHPSSY